MKKYFNLVKTGQTADIDIYGDITSWDWADSDVSSYTLAKQLEELGDVSQINVHINSYGGEVSEGLAIYNALRRHSAHVTTTCDGMACSIASVIFMAGDERVMYDTSLLMIHNAWSIASGNANDLRKQADDLDTITSASKAAYLANVSIDEDELSELMDNETWITPSEALEMGFSTVTESGKESDAPSQCAKRALMAFIAAQTAEDDGETPEEGEGEPKEPETGEDGESEDEIEESADIEVDEEPEDGESDEEDAEDTEEEPGSDEEDGQAEQKARFSAFLQAIQ